MNEALKIDPELLARVDSLATRAQRSPAEVVADALEHGHSLEWQERFVERVRAGLDDAAAGRYARPADFEKVADQIPSELMRVVWTRAALDSLEAAADYIAQDSPAAALRLVDDIPERTDAMLGQNPMIGRIGRVAGTRELVLPGTPYIVAYKVSDHVDVLAIVHGAREWPDDFSDA